MTLRLAYAVQYKNINNWIWVADEFKRNDL